jgi:hypothetical protein
LTSEERQLVNAKLRFFEGEAKAVYISVLRPVLLEVAHREITMPATYLGNVPVADPVERGRITRRREHTYRWFARIQDSRLEDAYRSRLQQYLTEGMEANDLWDLEMIDQVIEERAAGARWHEPARLAFEMKRGRAERLPKLSSYWQNQIGVVADQTKRWPEWMQAWAQDLIWKWYEHPAGGKNATFREIVSQYELELRARDQAIHEECLRNQPRAGSLWWQDLGGRLMKVWGDPCKRWFEDPSQRGAQELAHLQRRMRIFEDEDDEPCWDVVYWLQEYMKCVSALPTSMGGAQLQILQTWSIVQGSLALAVEPAKNIQLPTAPIAAATETLKVGEIVTPGARTGLGPQRVTAVLPDVEVLTPVIRTPRPGRALPEGVAPIETVGVESRQFPGESGVKPPLAKTGSLEAPAKTLVDPKAKTPPGSAGPSQPSALAPQAPTPAGGGGGRGSTSVPRYFEPVTEEEFGSVAGQGRIRGKIARPFNIREPKGKKPGRLGGGRGRTAAPARTSAFKSGDFKKYWNKQELAAAEFVWRTEGKFFRREAEIWLEKDGELVKSARRLDAVLFDNNGEVQAAEWSTPKNLSEGAAKKAQLEYQQELFEKAAEGWTLWARPSGEKSFYEITKAAQRTEPYPHWRKPKPEPSGTK